MNDGKILNVGLVALSRELLFQLLKFPAGSVIERAFIDEYRHPNMIMLVVNHPGLPAHVEGDVITPVNPSYRRLPNGEGEFVDWGSP